MDQQTRSIGSHRIRGRAESSAIAAVVAVTMLLTVWLALLVTLVQGHWLLLVSARAWAIFLSLLLSRQWVGLMVWAGLSGILFLLGLGGRPMRYSGIAVLAGIVIPVGLGLVGRVEGVLWPAFRATQGPLDRPLLDLPLLLYSVAAPFLLGRFAATHRQQQTAAVDRYSD